MVLKGIKRGKAIDSLKATKDLKQWLGNFNES